VHEERREIPGVVADGMALSAVAGAAGSVEVSARALAPEVPARRSASCTPRATLESCHLRIAADTPLSYVVAGPPAYGAASFDGARLTYLPDAGFTGADSLTYVATDGRGLRSAPATVTIDVAPAPPAAEPVTLHGPPPPHRHIAPAPLRGAAPRPAPRDGRPRRPRRRPRRPPHHPPALSPELFSLRLNNSRFARRAERHMRPGWSPL